MSDPVQFALDEKTRRELSAQLMEAINGYFTSLPNCKVQVPANKRTFAALTETLPEEGTDPARVLREVCAGMVDKGFHVPSANYFGLMNPTPAFAGVLAEALVAALNPQLATQNRSQLASKIENLTLHWIGERVGWTGGFGGTFTSGGNEANLTGLALALAHHFPKAIEDGVAAIGARPVLYASEESHHSLDKSAGMLGLGRSALRRLPVNARIQMDLDKLEAVIKADKAAGHKPFCVVATAGTTNSGAVDDMETIAEVCRQHNLWLHVDGAYGGAAIFSDRHRDLVRGIEKADSITIDPHKWLAMPFAAGVILTSHPELLEQAFGVSTPYMPKSAGATLPDNFKVSTQWSRRMNSLKLYLTLRIHGRKAYEAHIGRQLELARNFAERIRKSDVFGLDSEPMLTIVNLRLKIPGESEAALTAAHQAIVDEVTRSGERWISATQVRGRSVIRVMVISYLTGEKQLDDLFAALESAARKVQSVPAER